MKKLLCVLATGLGAASAHADPRLQTVTYNPDRVYTLRGFAGYQIDLQFESNETFAGLAAGDLDALAYNAQGNHLFLKPKAAKVATNLTVMTNRRSYQFDYRATADSPDPADSGLLYALRFEYPSAVPAPTAVPPPPPPRPRNVDYWYCGHRSLKPIATFDDGVHTHIRFGANAELPAFFVRNADGTESLLNFSIEANEVIVHRLAPRLVLRRGKLTGCIVNRGFSGAGERLESGSVTPGVIRDTKPPSP